ncbi:hypothetical protein QLX08_000856 [Tetragonisca angustula]|uniref:Uncharacterized protein n=1 Tax=Tetragonisca angustula TaxID=166442 RepID=A0AAW1AIR4_9HYME
MTTGREDGEGITEEEYDKFTGCTEIPEILPEGTLVLGTRERCASWSSTGIEAREFHPGLLDAVRFTLSTDHRSTVGSLQSICWKEKESSERSAPGSEKFGARTNDLVSADCT